MKNIFLVCWLLSLAFLSKIKLQESDFIFPSNFQAIPKDTLPRGIKILLAAYPQSIAKATATVILWKDGSEMRFDDGVANKSFQELLDHPDLEDQVNAMTYPQIFTPPLKNSDAGRVRYEPFFLKMYGKTEAEVKANLVEITWLPKNLNQKILVSKINGVAEQLNQISQELDKHPEWVKYLSDPGGTFNWRKISGTDRLSTHSFGITIDVNTTYSNYWQWDNKAWKEKGEALDLGYVNRIPTEMVRIFEKYGFIWGGKWYHYDTMHFEYRPEVLGKKGRY